jgi:hypothetical protein
MRVKNTTQRFQAFVQNLQESFWGDFQGKTREVLKKLLESDAEQPQHFPPNRYLCGGNCAPPT